MRYPIPKKTKNGIQDQDIIPMIREISITQISSREVEINCLICCQNPTLNPMQLPAAIAIYKPEYAPDFTHCVRVEIFDVNQQIFR